MDRKRFREFLHDNFEMTDDVIMDRIFKYFNRIPTDDIDSEEWVRGFSVFLKGCIAKLSQAQAPAVEAQVQVRMSSIIADKPSIRKSIGTSGRRCSRSPLGGRLATTLVATVFIIIFLAYNPPEQHITPLNSI